MIPAGCQVSNQKYISAAVRHKFAFILVLTTVMLVFTISISEHLP